MNTPNKLTLLRVILVPVFLVFLMISGIPGNYLLALIVFAAASATDAIDGHLARKNDQVTTFGKFLDPLADKVLVLSAMICFIELGLASSVAVVIMIAREFMVTSLRLVAVSGDGTVIAAGLLGKIKTVIQMVSIVVILLLCTLSGWNVFPGMSAWVPVVSHVLIWVCAAITLISGVQYLIRNWSSISVTK